VRLLLEDVTLLKDHQLTVHVRFKGGATHTLTIPRQLSAWQMRKTPQPVLDAINAFLNEMTDHQIARQLKAQALQSGTGHAFTARIVSRLRRNYGLKNRYDRLPQAGMLTPQEAAKQLDISTTTLHLWRRAGRLRAHVYNDKGECLYEPLGENPTVKQQGKRLLRQPDGTTL
jgi:hypothetical protein